MYKIIENGTVTSVKGILAAGIHAGIKKYKKDLALVYSKTECNVAGTFTINKVKAAPLLVSQEIVNKHSKVRAVLVNSGNANACTGEKGFENALLMQGLCADSLSLKPNEVLVSSTGVIGQQLPMEQFHTGIPAVVAALTETGGNDAAEAIMTTDKKSKQIAVEVTTSKGVFTIGGIGKGSGMIAPNMATMLVFITTDAAVDTELLQMVLKQSVKRSYNRISVDGETSTNDMVTVMANGESGVEISMHDDTLLAFSEALDVVNVFLAKEIVADGEGATKLITIAINGAKSVEDADLIGRSVSNSSLVKTAIYGEDANWGRIVSAVGQSGADVVPEKISVFFDDLAILKENYDIVLDEEAAAKVLAEKEFTITINLGVGDVDVTWWTCDFTEEYIKINASYRS